MSTTSPTVLPEAALHLPLDEIFDQQLNDLSGNNYTCEAQAGVELVLDDTFGACVKFNGTSSFLAVDTRFRLPRAFTVSAWLNQDDTAPNDLLPLNVLGFGTGTRDARGAWVNIAWTYENGTTQLYRDGKLQLGNQSLTPAFNEALIIGGGFNGKLACFKVFDKVLTEEEIRLTRERDRTANFTYKTTYPIDFSLLDDGLPNLLYISDALIPQTFSVQVSNRSDHTIYLSSKAPASGAPHFRLRFAANTFSVPPVQEGATEQPANLTFNADSAPSWKADPPVVEDDGKLAVNLYYTGASVLGFPVGSPLSFRFAYYSANGSGGARSISVELSYQDLSYDDPSTTDVVEGDIQGNIVGQRAIPVDIVNQRGKKNIPLRVGFVGINRILNDGSDNELTVRIWNELANDALGFRIESEANTDASSESTTKYTMFTLTFDDPAGEVWDLTSQSKLGNITVNPAANSTTQIAINKDELGGRPRFEIRPLVSELAPDGYLEFQIKGIQSDTPSGFANIYLSYEDVPGYWDGSWVLPVEKTPISVFGNAAARNVGIGCLPEEKYKLSVAGRVRARGGLTLGELSTGAHPGPELLYLRKGNVRLDDWQHLGWGTARTKITGAYNYLRLSVNHKSRLFINTQGRIGIGTDTPQHQLDVKGGIAASGELYIGASGSPQSLTLYGASNLHGHLSLDGTAKFQGRVDIGTSRSPQPLVHYGNAYWRGDHDFYGSARFRGSQGPHVRIVNGTLNIGSVYLGERQLKTLVQLANVLNACPPGVGKSRWEAYVKRFLENAFWADSGIGLAIDGKAISRTRNGVIKYDSRRAPFKFVFLP